MYKDRIEDTDTAQKMKFFIKDFFSKCDHKSLMENFMFCAVRENGSEKTVLWHDLNSAFLLEHSSLHTKATSLRIRHKVFSIILLQSPEASEKLGLRF